MFHVKQLGVEKMINEIINNKRLNNFINAICIKYYRKFFLDNYFDYEEFKQEIYVDLCKYLKSYDENKSKLTTYIYKTIENCSSNLYQKQLAKKRIYKKVNIDNEYIKNTIKDNSDTTINIEYEELIQYLINKHKKDKYYKFIIIKLCEGYNSTQIAKLLNVSRSVTDRRIHKLREEIKEYYKQ